MLHTQYIPLPQYPPAAVAAAQALPPPPSYHDALASRGPLPGAVWIGPQGAVPPPEPATTTPGQVNSDLEREIATLIERRCVRCGGLYTLAEGGRCFYHPGHFRDPDATNIRDGAVTGWTCCNIAERVKMPPMVAAMGFMPGVSEMVFLSPESQKREYRGCQTAPAHEEDVAHTRALSSFPLDIGALRAAHAARMRLRLKEEEETAAAAVAVLDPSLKSDDAFLVHAVTPLDTLLGLQLRYGVSAATLRRYNPQMVGDVFGHLPALRIPRGSSPTPPPLPTSPDTQAKRRLACDLFSKRTKCTVDEARYYLEAAQWDANEALREYESDVAFEGAAKSK